MVGEDELPRLSHGRSLLRQFTPDDVSTVMEAASDPYIQQLSGLAPEDLTGAAEYLASRTWRAVRGFGFSFAIADTVDEHAVGQIGLWFRERAPDGATGYREAAHGRAALGYWISPRQRRKGYATDALAAMSTWALSFPDVYRLELFIEPWNEGSWRAAERAGYQREGLLRSWQLLGDSRRDMYIYSRLPSS